MLENSSLRESLAGMERQLISLLNQQQATVSKVGETCIVRKGIHTLCIYFTFIILNQVSVP